MPAVLQLEAGKFLNRVPPFPVCVDVPDLPCVVVSGPRRTLNGDDHSDSECIQHTRHRNRQIAIAKVALPDCYVRGAGKE